MFLLYILCKRLERGRKIMIEDPKLWNLGWNRKLPSNGRSLVGGSYHVHAKEGSIFCWDPSFLKTKQIKKVDFHPYSTCEYSSQAPWSYLSRNSRNFFSTFQKQQLVIKGILDFVCFFIWVKGKKARSRNHSLRTSFFRPFLSSLRVNS